MAVGIVVLLLLFIGSAQSTHTRAWIDLLTGAELEPARLAPEVAVGLRRALDACDDVITDNERNFDYGFARERGRMRV